MDVKEQDILGDGIEKHWYYVAKGNALLQFLDGYSAREILDVGAGSGFFSKRLLCAGFCERATCIDTAYSVERAEMHCGKRSEEHTSELQSQSNLVCRLLLEKKKKKNYPNKKEHKI